MSVAKIGPYTSKDASLSPDGVYRWWLSRGWRPFGVLPERPLVVIGLNPSTADAAKDDPTIRRCVGFAKSWGHDGLLMLNLFAFRATEPHELRITSFDPVGAENDDVIRANVRGRRVLCAWGTTGFYQDRDQVVLALVRNVGAELVVLGRTKDGAPKHPLYVPAITQPVPA